jgi:hypothetical protein
MKGSLRRILIAPIPGRQNTNGSQRERLHSSLRVHPNVLCDNDAQRASLLERVTSEIPENWRHYQSYRPPSALSISSCTIAHLSCSNRADSIVVSNSRRLGNRPNNPALARIPRALSRLSTSFAYSSRDK